MTGRNIYQLGIRSGTRDELLFAEKNTNLNRFNVLEPVELLVKEAKGRPIYVSIDIDVVDPAFANGTGTPEPGGISSSELIKAVYVLKSANVVGADVVEVSPEYDISDRTSLLAAKLLRELIIIICRNRVKGKKRCDMIPCREAGRNLVAKDKCETRSQRPGGKPGYYCRA